MATLRSLFRFDRNSKVEPPTPKNVYLGIPIDYAESGTLSRSILGETVIKEPLLRKGIWKENRDIFNNGWTLTNKDKTIEIDENLLRIIDDFNRQTHLSMKLEEAGRSANIYGDGFLELIFDEPYKKDLISQPIPTNLPLVDVNLLNAEYIDRVEKKNNINFYIYKSTKNPSNKIFVHPERIVHVVKKRLPGKIFGISDVYTGQQIIESKLTADKQFGEFIEWTGTGVFDVTYNGANKDDIDKIKQNIKTTGRSKVNLHNEDMTWSVLNPVIFNPAEFAKYFYINIAALVDMPEYVLTGVQPGQLTGSEMGFTDYMNNITNIQEQVFTPILERMYMLVLRNTQYSMDDFEIFWNPSYIDEQSEALIGKTRAETGSLLFDRNAIDDEEFKAIMKNGLVDKKGNSVFKPVEIQPESVMKPEDKPVPPEIQNLWDEIAVKQRQIGERELVEQEKRIKKQQ